jgi:hypothetical protein
MHPPVVLPVSVVTLVEASVVGPVVSAVVDGIPVSSGLVVEAVDVPDCVPDCVPPLVPDVPSVAATGDSASKQASENALSPINIAHVMPRLILTC